MKRMLMAGVIALAVAAMPATASAVPFTGQLDYTGTHTSDNADLDLATQSTIDLNIVLIATDAFATAGISVGDTLTHVSPLQYRPAGTPFLPLWSHAGSGVSFDLLTMSIDFSSDNQLNLSGTGTFKGGGFDDTPGRWTMTLNNAGELTGSFSSSSTAVPEPVTTALLGLGMLGVAGRVRRRFAQR